MNMFKHTTVLYLVICSLLSIVFIQNCSHHKSKQIIIKTPEVSGKLVDTAPKTIKDSIVIKDSVRLIMIESLEKSILEKEEFDKASDTSKKNMYSEAKKVNTYKKTLENEDVKIDYTAVTTGTLDHLEFDYTLKSKKISVPQKNKSHLLMGGSITTNTKIDKVALNVNVGLQNRRGDVLYATYGTDNSVQVGYMFRIF